MTDETPARPTSEEMLGSLTGYDEEAIAAAFGMELLTMLDGRETTYSRALIFAHRRRDGASDSDALQYAKGLPLRDLGTYFEPEPEDVFPDEPTSDAGKGSSGPGSAPRRKPRGASSPDSPPTPTEA
jgi:hypothetical protein